MAGKAELYMNALNGFLGKSDGRDKLCATVQYLCMCISAGEPGNLKKIQGSVAAARKIFRIMRPFECLAPLLSNPGFAANKPMVLQLINKLKSVLMATYFGADHIVWAGQVQLISDAKVIERAQKVSLWSWFLGSGCTIVSESVEVAKLQRKLERAATSSAECSATQPSLVRELHQRLFVLTHAVFQALLAIGLLQLLPVRPRTVGLLGVIASAMNCYMLLPPLPSLKPKSA